MNLPEGFLSDMELLKEIFRTMLDMKNANRVKRFFCQNIMKDPFEYLCLRKTPQR